MQQNLFSDSSRIKLPELVVKKTIGCGQVEQLLIRAGEYGVKAVEDVGNRSDDAIITLDCPNSLRIYLHQGVRKKIDTSLICAFTKDRFADVIDVTSLKINSLERSLIPKDVVIKSWAGAMSLRKETEEVKGLRNAQVGAVHSVLAHWSKSHEPATVVLPTGTGKTETMLAVSIMDQPQLVVVIVPSQDLRQQISEKFIHLGVLKNIGVLHGDALHPRVATLSSSLNSEEQLDHLLKCNVVVSTPMLLVNNPSFLKRISQKVSHVYFDEAHHLKAKSWKFLKDTFSNSKLIQFTATPYRLDRQPIEGNVVYQYPLNLAQKDKCFSEISLITVDERNPSKKDLSIAHAAYERLVKDREENFLHHCMMVRSGSKERADALYELYRKEFPSERIIKITSGTKGKKQKINEIKNGKYAIVVCVDMLKEGFDYPNFKIAAVHDLHKSLAVAMQFIGRFTRDREDLGRAHMVVNFAEEDIPQELEKLYAEGSGWDKVIAEVAQSKQEEAIEFIEFLSKCLPFKSFDNPDQQISPRLVNPALSCVVYRCSGVDWGRFPEGFSKKYRFSQPYENKDRGLFYFATQAREPVKWTKSEAIRDQLWTLVMLHYSEAQGLLYVGCSDRKFKHKNLVKAISTGKYALIEDAPVFRSFQNIKRLKIIHAGLLKPANRNHRYSKYSGADVTTQLQGIQQGGRVRKSDFVGVGYREGQPVGVGASKKGKVWHPARIGSPKEWIDWCQMTGSLLIDETIDPDQIFQDSAEVTELEHFPISSAILALDWNEETFSKYHRLSILDSKGQNFPFYLCEFSDWQWSNEKLEFAIKLGEELEIFIEITLDSEDGHSVRVLGDESFFVSGWVREDQPIEEFLKDYPPTLYLSDGSLVSGCQHTKFQNVASELPEGFILSWDWSGCDIKQESAYKVEEGTTTFRPRSIQQRVMEAKRDEGAVLVFNDDGAGESADIVAVFEEEDSMKIQLLHCKFSKASTSGHRVGDLYEVCGQAIKSVKWKWEPKTLLKHLKSRKAKGLLPQQRFFHGDEGVIDRLLEGCEYKVADFEFWIVQPGLSPNALPDDIKRLLSASLSTISDMTECSLHFISGNQ
ncbi:DEAD/DEAH box helicase [Cerasicoccus frondis]|uniref:DEAD/DEAH box helicase n=1 Tax=Cerasicoccus frondis TaxID=490090 RepID=UPI00285285A4|nr:DEAD/DEAH box helicase family protein [Cerasicoccus frondis]